jgi:hypothetical protein
VILLSWWEGIEGEGDSPSPGLSLDGRGVLHKSPLSRILSVGIDLEDTYE